MTKLLLALSSICTFVPSAISTSNILNIDLKNSVSKAGEVNLKKIEDKVANDSILLSKALILDEGMEKEYAFLSSSSIAKYPNSDYAAYYSCSELEFDLVPFFENEAYLVGYEKNAKIHVHFNAKEIRHVSNFEGNFYFKTPNYRFGINGKIELLRNLSTGMKVNIDMKYQIKTPNKLHRFKEDKGALGLNFRIENIKLGVDPSRPSIDETYKPKDDNDIKKNRASWVRFIKGMTGFTTFCTTNLRGWVQASYQKGSYYFGMPQSFIDNPHDEDLKIIYGKRTSWDKNMENYNCFIRPDFVEDDYEYILLPEFDRNLSDEDKKIAMTNFITYELNDSTEDKRFTVDMNWNKNPNLLTSSRGIVKVTDNKLNYSKYVDVDINIARDYTQAPISMFSNGANDEKISINSKTNDYYFISNPIVQEKISNKIIKNNVNILSPLNVVADRDKKYGYLKINNINELFGLNMDCDFEVIGKENLVKVQLESDKNTQIILRAFNSSDTKIISVKYSNDSDEELYKPIVDKNNINFGVGEWEKVQIFDNDFEYIKLKNDDYVESFIRGKFLYVRTLKMLSNYKLTYKTGFDKINLDLILNSNYKKIRPLLESGLETLNDSGAKTIKISNWSLLKDVKLVDVTGDYDIYLAPTGYLSFKPLVKNPDWKSINFSLKNNDVTYNYDALKNDFVDRTNYDVPKDFRDKDNGDKTDNSNNDKNKKQNQDNALPWKIISGTFVTFSVSWFIASLIKIKKLRDLQKLH